ncbi:unnamed protein product [Cladocopium goreaui]|uniref:Methyltransferase domain-containing protein n=1 Tax=Cladocopium goreaui TaxID=2562237 RepID=A0A9P1G617_9DINO|nr:unnamed protein product [Cladocopium goreaui]
MAGVPTEPVPVTDAAVPVTSAVQMGSGVPISTTYPMETGAPQVVYTSSPYVMPGAASVSAMPMTSYTTMPMAYSGLDHSQGKWFAPGEALPPGFIITAHPEGHTAPQEGHTMSDKARESFVITTGTAGTKAGAAPKAPVEDVRSLGEEEQEEEVQRLLLSALDCEGVAPLRCATSPVQMGSGIPVSTTYPMETGAPQVVYTSSPYVMPGAASVSAMPMTSYTTMPMAYSGLDHSQGKWFAPGEALPPGFIITAHPEGHTAPQEGHMMSDKARESFVITTGTGTKAGASQWLECFNAAPEQEEQEEEVQRLLLRTPNWTLARS